jgi:hypothetical protein
MGTAHPARQVTLVLIDGYGQQQSIDLAGPGGAMRVAVGRPGHRSSVWRVWANQSKSDVYVAARVLAGKLKFSLHESGDWRHQWVTTEKAQLFTGQNGRVIDQWPRPPAGPGGWTRGLTIWVPSDDLLDFQDDTQPLTGVDWIPEPPSGSAVGLHVVVAEPDRGFSELRAAMPIGGFVLADGRVVLVVVSVPPLEEGPRLWLDQRRIGVNEAARAVKSETMPGRRIALFGFDSDGNRLVWDLAWR